MSEGRREALEELDRLSGAVARAKAAVAEGRAVDVNGLDTRVRGLCDRVEALPPDEGRGMLPALNALLADVGRLAESVEQQLTELRRQLDDAAARRQAAAAYGRADRGGERK
jgi:hypothetical protein